MKLECTRCGKPAEHPHIVGGKRLCEPCALTVTDRDDPALARMIRDHRRNRALRERDNFEFSARKKKVLGLDWRP